MQFRTKHIRQKQISLSDVWSDDPQDPDYNHGFHGPDHPYSHERLYRSDPLYDAFGILDYNWPIAVPGAGSAIFLHIWRKPRHPTEGCVAFDRRNLVWIFENWQPRSRVVIRG
jgi:L,D-peptidoglycan transpeptidase YkuD (ErfK/YbiS/YcfS/YnhG family)